MKEITFAGNHIVEKDTEGDFPSPEWLDIRYPPDNSPVCYTRKTKVRMTAKFHVDNQPSASESVEVRGSGVFESATLKWTGTVTVNPGDSEVTVSGLVSDLDLPDIVACLDPARITWEANPAATGWAGAGTSSNLFYLVLADPSGTPPYWTLLDISCRAAHGQTTEAGLVSDSYTPFQSRALTRKRDGQGLTYWNPPSTTCTNTRFLLASPDGSGQCGSWAEFLIDMFKCHGVTTAHKIEVIRSKAEVNTVGFLVKNWTFNGTGSNPAPWTHALGTECVEQSGVAGQRNPNPPPAFFNHFIVLHGGKFYDPSYGSAPVATQSEWENGSIDGLFNEPLGAAGFPKASNSSTNLLEFWDLDTGAKI